MDPAVVRVHITQIDHHMVNSGSLDYTALPKAPVIRIFGRSSLGVNCCLYVHQVYPYFYVEYPGRMDPESGAWLDEYTIHQRSKSPAIVNRYILRLSQSLNNALSLSLKRNPYSPSSKFVRAIVLVKGVHFYGFHSSYSPFLKIHIVDPTLIRRATTIMQSGAIMATHFHVFEGHISFILQFLCDFGLYGCGWINASEVWQRCTDNPNPGMQQQQFQASPYFRQTRMSLEIDTTAPHILNRLFISARDVHNQLKIPADPLPSDPFVLSVRELWEDERRRRVAAGLDPTPAVPRDPSEGSRERGGGWVAEARWWEDIRMRIQQESGHDFKTKELPWARWVMTTFDSVQSLWPDTYKTWRPSRNQADEANPYADASGSSQEHAAPAGEGGGVEQDVDVALLSSQDMSDLVQEEDNPWEEIRASQEGLPGDGEDEEDSFYEDHLEAEGRPARSHDREQYAWFFSMHTYVLIVCSQSFMSGGPQTPRQAGVNNSHRDASVTPRKRPYTFEKAFHKLAG
jgi:DNA polymerase zeta